MQWLSLNNGIKMPMLGYGVFQITDLEQCEECVVEAINQGYRLIDTASLYANEEAVGKAIKRSSVPREELLITSKVWIQDAGYKKTHRAFELSLKKLELDYLDLYLIHEPFGDYYGAWKAMEELYLKGKIKAIGVCNFSSDRLLDLYLNNQINPSINQIEIHPFFQQSSSIQIMKKYNIQPQGWGPLAEGQRNIFENEILLNIARQYHKSVAQTILRWHIQRGIVVIPKTIHKNRMKENMEIWDFELNEKDMERISEMDLGYSEIINHQSVNTVRWLNNCRFND